MVSKTSQASQLSPASQDFAALLPPPPQLAQQLGFWSCLGAVDEVVLINLSENAMYRVAGAGKRYVLRLSQPGYQSDDALRSEADWLNFLNQQVSRHSDLDLVLSAALPGGNGECVQTLNLETPFRAVLFDYLPGRPIARAALGETDFGLLGKTAAVFAHLTQDFAAPRPAWFSRPHWHESDFLSPHYAWGDWRAFPGLSTKMIAELEGDEAQVVTTLAASRQAGDAGTLVHGDMRAANLLRRADGGLALLDFDDCGYSWPLFDLAAALSFDEALPTLGARVQAWIAGYNSVAAKPIDDDALSILPHLIAMRRLSLLGWMTTHPLAPEARELGVEFASKSVGLFARLRSLLS